MINKAIIVGNLGADPDLRFTAGGKAVAELRVATSFGSGDNEKTEWHRVVVWEKSAEACGKYLKKGSKVYVEGRLQTRQYEDKDGVTKYTTEIVATEVKFLSSKGGEAQEAAEAEAPARPSKPARGKQAVADDDLPF